MNLTKKEIQARIIEELYNEKTLNNSHRGDFAEILCLMALGPNWKLVGLGWHPWDLQLGNGKNRVRIQVKNTAYRQLWGLTKTPMINFGWSKKAPSDFSRYNPGERIESEGYFCDIFLIAIHDGEDQMNPNEWKFLVIPTSDLVLKTKTMILKKALKKWKSVDYRSLKSTVYSFIK